MNVGDNQKTHYSKTKTLQELLPSFVPLEEDKKKEDKSVLKIRRRAKLTIWNFTSRLFSHVVLNEPLDEIYLEKLRNESQIYENIPKYFTGC